MDCKICAAPAYFVFDLPESKNTGGPIPEPREGERLANFYECSACQFLFSDITDDRVNFYEEVFNQTMYEPEIGSEIQYMRLLHLASRMIRKPLWKCRILDYGCGVGHFVKVARSHLGLDVHGFDLARFDKPRPFIHSTEPEIRFNIVVAREVVEHFTDPVRSFTHMRELLAPHGVIAFQTSLYQPGANDRSWGYIGPNNGHISLYSSKALRVLRRQLGVTRVLNWSGQQTVTAWKVHKPPAGQPAAITALTHRVADLTAKLRRGIGFP